MHFLQPSIQSGDFFCNLVYRVSFDSSSMCQPHKDWWQQYLTYLQVFPYHLRVHFLLIEIYWVLSNIMKLVFPYHHISFPVILYRNAVAKCPRISITLSASPPRYWRSWSSLYSTDVRTLGPDDVDPTQTMNAAFQDF